MDTIDMKEQFCTYEIALKLKELGFNEGCFAAYYPDGELIGLKWYDNNNHRIESPKIAAPLWQQAEQFLREKFNLNIELYYLPLSEKWGGEVYNLNEEILGHSIDGTSTYEEAREKTILKAIELCKKI